ncbi:MAG: multidrug effflux MFS transporter [Rhodospirillales bacterium]|nr:multidrug effflux MFS transporter [Rhodospirillales bacterium]MDH3919826.1 multidrug effflux MFS transporter [Rhodospirillales bacterium]MDH3965385.1 multidrug effflux MFS transporter [Rhodospirillales bacterium]
MVRPDNLAVAVLLTALVAFGAISTDLYLPSLPAIARAFASDTAEVQLTLSVFLAGFAASQVVYGPLSDRYGRRPVLIAGLGLYVAASLACMAAPDIGFLIAARFLQALGACAGVVLGRAVVRDVYGRERAAKALSYMSMAMALAPALGPILGGYLQVWFGWRANFLVLASFGASCLLAVFLLLPETNPSRDAAATRGAQMLRNYLTLARDPAYVGYVLVGAFAYGGIFAFISGSSFVLIDVLGLSPDRYGLCFGAVVVGYMIGTFASGRLSLAVGLDRLILTGTLVGLAGGVLALGLALSDVLGVAAVVAPTFLYLIGAGLMLPNAIAGAIGPYPTMAGTASAFLGVVQMGLAACIGIAVGHLHDGTARGMFAATAAVAAGALASYLLLVRRDGQAVRGV